MLRLSPGTPQSTQGRSSASQEQQQHHQKASLYKGVTKGDNVHIQIRPLNLAQDQYPGGGGGSLMQEFNAAMASNQQYEDQEYILTKPAYKSPNARGVKWSPVVHTIKEAGESAIGPFDAAINAAHLALSSEQEKVNGNETLVEGGNTMHMKPLLAPALETNVGYAPRHYQDSPVTMDQLVKEIQRLTRHDFNAKPAAPYPGVLEGLYQRLSDYNICLKNARKKLGDRPISTASQHASPMQASGPVVVQTPLGNSPYDSRNRLIFDNNHSNNLQPVSPFGTPGTTSAGVWNGNSPFGRRARTFSSASPRAAAATGPTQPYTFSPAAAIQSTQDNENDPLRKIISQLEGKVLDLEHQLVQSRKAHHGLLQEHIVTMRAVASTSGNGTTTTTGAPSLALASGGQDLAATDVKIQSILAAVPNFGSNKTALSSTTTTAAVAGAAAQAGKTIPGTGFTASSPSLSEPQSRQMLLNLSKSQASLQETLRLAQEQQQRQLDQLKGHSRLTTVESSDQLALDSQTMMNEAVTRLLIAETELGMLKLVMAQNQEEISGLEEEVFVKQKELNQHRHLFESLIESSRLGFLAQIQEDRLQIRDLEGKMSIQAKESLERIQCLEEEIRVLEERLMAKKDNNNNERAGTGAGSFTVAMEAKVQELEGTIEELKQEIQQKDKTLSELEDKIKKVERLVQELTEQGTEDMMEYMEKEYKKKTLALKTNLTKSQKASVKLQNEVSAMAVRIVRIQTLNEELEDSAEKDQAEISRLQAEIAVYQDTIEQLRQGSKGGVACTAGEGWTSIVSGSSPQALYEKITALEIQMEELQSCLRLKELELEQALEETERMMMQLSDAESRLEQDLAAQKLIHQAEMTKFDQEKKQQAQRERAGQAASVTLFQNMVTKLQDELAETQEKLRDTTLCWGHTKEQLQKCDASYRRRKRELEETTRALQEVNETVMHLGDAIGLLEKEKESNLELVRSLAEKDQALAEMEYRLKQLEEEA